MRPACPPPAPPSNRNAPTPSTRLLPRTPQLESFELKQTAQCLKPGPLCRPGPAPECHSRGVLVLARPSAREDGAFENQNARTFLDLSLGAPEVSDGNPKKPSRKRPGNRS